MTRTNSFLAMGFEPDDAVVYAIRTDLADAIAAYLGDRPQQEAANVLGLSQSLISRITRGRVEGLSIERLVRAMVRANIPGFARWPTADTASAGVLNHAAATATASAHVDIDAYYSDLDLDINIDSLWTEIERPGTPQVEAE